jgi:hypothetical protein
MKFLLVWLAGFLVRGVLATTRAELVQFDAIWVVAAVLLGDVVAFFAVSACKRDLGSNVGRLGHGGAFRSVLRVSVE